MIKNPFCILSKGELLLWIISLITVTASFLFSPSKDFLTLTASLIGVTALIFIARGHVFGQILSVIFAVFYGIVSYCFRYYGETITYLGMSAPISILSTISWLLHPYEKTDEVEVSRVTKKQVFVICGLALLVTGFFYFILKALNNANLIVSVISVTTSFIASYLTFLRSPWYAVAYSVNDIILIILWILASMEKTDYVPMIMCFVMFLINDLYGFYSWRKMLKRQRGNGGL
jgi:nicotinamide mononucleotide transporter PnuC